MSENTKGQVDEETIDDDDDEGTISQEHQYLTFHIASEIYGIPILSVVEIIRMLQITPIPESLNFIKGIINLRGKIIPVMDVRLRFGLEERAHDDRTCIIVVNIQNIVMGLVVDQVAEVLEIPEKQVEPMPDVGQSDSKRYVKGIGRVDSGVKILLDLDKLIFEEALRKMQSLSK